jgi:hypothetical protein
MVAWERKFMLTVFYHGWVGMSKLSDCKEIENESGNNSGDGADGGTRDHAAVR